MTSQFGSITIRVPLKTIANVIANPKANAIEV